MHWIKHDKRGAYIVILALIFPACLFVMGTLIDIGLVYATRARLQDVADAAALAGAQSLTDGDRTANDAARYYFAGRATEVETPYGSYISISGAPDNRMNLTASLIEFSEDGKTFASAANNESDGTVKNRYIRVSLSARPNSIFLESAVRVFNMDPLKIPTITVQSVAYNQGAATIFADGDLSVSANSVTLTGLVHTNGNLIVKGLQKPTRPDDISASGSITDASNLLHNSQTAKQNMPKITQYTAENDTSKLKFPYNSPTVNLSYLTNNGFTKEPLAQKPNVFIVTDGDITITCDAVTTSAIYATFYAPNGTITVKKGANINKAYTFTLYGSIVAKKVVIDLPNGAFAIYSFEPQNPPAALVR